MTRQDTLRTALPAIALLLLTAAFMVTRTGRDALYFQEDGLYALPEAYIAIALLAIPQAMIVLRLLRTVGGRATRVGSLIVVTLAVAGFYPLAEPGGGLLMTGFFVMVPLVFSILFSMVWLLGAELHEDAPRDTIAIAFSRFGAASIIGGIVGGALARTIGPTLGPRSLLLAGAGLIAATLVCVLWAHRRFKLRGLTPGDVADSAGDGPSSAGDDVDRAARPDDRLLAQPHVALLLGISMTAALAAIFIDFQFYLTAAVAGGDSEQMTIFFANVYILLNAASLLLQLLVTPRLQRWLGMGGSLLVLPFTLFGGAAAATFVQSTVTRAGLRIAEGGLKSGVHRSTWEQAFLLLPKARRATAKVVIDGLGTRIAEGIAAGALYVWLAVVVGSGDVADHSITWVAACLVATTLVWLAFTAGLRRRLAGDVSEADASDSAIRPPVPDW